MMKKVENKRIPPFTTYDNTIVPQNMLDKLVYITSASISPWQNLSTGKTIFNYRGRLIASITGLYPLVSEEHDMIHCSLVKFSRSSQIWEELFQISRTLKSDYYKTLTYGAGSIPTRPFIEPRHQSFVGLSTRRMMSPFRKQSSPSSSGSKSYSACSLGCLEWSWKR